MPLWLLLRVFRFLHEESFERLTFGLAILGDVLKQMCPLAGVTDHLTSMSTTSHYRSAKALRLMPGGTGYVAWTAALQFFLNVVKSPPSVTTEMSPA